MKCKATVAKAITFGALGLSAGIFGAFASPAKASVHPRAIAVNQPLGGMGLVFLSPVDGQVYGVLCPQSAFGLPTTLEAALRCGYTVAYGPISLHTLLHELPSGINLDQLRADLTSTGFVQVTSTRDKYYDIWSVLASGTPALSSTSRGGTAATARAGAELRPSHRRRV